MQLAGPRTAAGPSSLSYGDGEETVSATKIPMAGRMQLCPTPTHMNTSETKNTQSRTGEVPELSAATQVPAGSPSACALLPSGQSVGSRVPSAACCESRLAAAPLQRRWQQRAGSIVAAVATARRNGLTPGDGYNSSVCCCC